MKRIVAALFLLLAFLCGCSKNEKVESSVETPVPADAPKISAYDIANFVMTENSADVASLSYINESYESKALSAYIENIYRIAPSDWVDCSIYRTQSAENAFEVSVFALSSASNKNNVLSGLEEYLIARQGDFFGYNPEQADIISNSVACLSDDGKWAAVFISSASDAYKAAFDKLVGSSDAIVPKVTAQPSSEEKAPTIVPSQSGEAGDYPSYWLKYVDPEQDDMTLWDNTAFVEAVKSGNSSALEGNDIALYNKITQILDSIIDENMTELEKEQAVYKWLCTFCDYDFRHYDIPNNAPRESYEPYGAIVEGKAVCLGYATAFQLFMDILDIECITVIGAAYASREDHSWNMVKIDDQWVCVDSTWDSSAAKNGPEFFRFFNVSSEFLALTDHQWDYNAYPIALPEETGFGMIHKIFEW